MGKFIGLKVIKRSGEQVPLRLDEITKRNTDLCKEIIVDGKVVADVLDDVDPQGVTLEVITRYVKDFQAGTLSTEVIDLMTVDALNDLWKESSQNAILAGRVLMSSIQKTCQGSFSQRIAERHRRAPKRITKDFADVVAAHAEAFDAMIKPERDFMFDLQSARTLIGAYLHNDPTAEVPKTHEELHAFLRSRHGALVVETPQHAYMRAAIAVYLQELIGSDYGESREEVIGHVRDLYEELSCQRGSLASPFIFNAGSARKATASCMLMSPADNLPSILETELQGGICSSLGAGVGVGWQEVRAKGSRIRSTGGSSTGVPSWIRGHAIKRDTITQGGYRPGASAHYIPWFHTDFEMVIQMAENSGYLASRNLNAPDLMYGAVLDGNFFKMYNEDRAVVLLDPGMPEVADMIASETIEEFNKKFWHLQENPPKGAKTRMVRDIYRQIYMAIRERGFPYVWYWDNSTRQSNMSSYMKKLVWHSNLCAEITIIDIPPERDLEAPENPTQSEMEEWVRRRYGEIGVCVLASVNLSAFASKGKTDLQGIRKTAGILARALDVSLDAMVFNESLKGAELSVQRHRNIAVGVCGLAGALQKMRLAYASKEGLLADEAMQAAVYLGAAEASCALGEQRGGFPGATPDCHSSRGLIQPQLFYREDKSWAARLEKTSAKFGEAITVADWKTLEEKFSKGFLRNAYVTATMPTASTAVIMRTTQGADPRHNNIYTVKQQSSRSVTYNEDLLDCLREEGLYSDETLEKLVASEGSVKDLPLSDDLKKVFLAAHEQPPEFVVLHAAVTQPFCCQSKSTNFNLPAPDMHEMYTIHALAHKLGCVTGSYYVYSQGAASSVSWLNSKPTKDSTDSTDSEDTDSEDTPTPPADAEGKPPRSLKVPLLRGRGVGCESGACSL